MEKKIDIELPWCIYGAFSMGIGKVEKDFGKTCSIKYNDSQTSLFDLWDSKHISRFKTLEEAIEVFAKRTGKHIDSVRKMAKNHF